MGIMSPSITVVKLGGSLITDKDSPLALNERGIVTAARAISKSLKSRHSRPLMIIHGGGSFGHYYASKYHVSTVPSRAPKIGVSKIAASMIDLHSEVLGRLVEYGVPCKTVLTSEFMSPDGSSVTEDGERTLAGLFRKGFVPVSFGNISIAPTWSIIISGDQISLCLARRIGVKRTIFAMDVDGIYPNSRLRGEILRVLNRREVKTSGHRKYDVTGGIVSKIDVGFRLAKLGSIVYYVNGSNARRLEHLITGRDDVLCTTINPNDI